MTNYEIFWQTFGTFERLDFMSRKAVRLYGNVAEANSRKFCQGVAI
jgi:hypothetical protein